MTDSRDDLSQCGCDTCVMKDKTSNSVQACSDLAHVVLVLVGVRRVTVVIVHIGLDGVCEGCDVVGSDHAPQAGVAQGV